MDKLIPSMLFNMQDSDDLDRYHTHIQCIQNPYSYRVWFGKSVTTVFLWFIFTVAYYSAHKMWTLNEGLLWGKNFIFWGRNYSSLEVALLMGQTSTHKSSYLSVHQLYMQCWCLFLEAVGKVNYIKLPPPFSPSKKWTVISQYSTVMFNILSECFPDVSLTCITVWMWYNTKVFFETSSLF